MKINLTDEQLEAVKNEGGNVLVSAAAGSGKTKVLIERLFRHVEEGYHLDDFLVITYTNAAARELKQKILEELNERIAERPNDRHLREQMYRVYLAQISTIHAFCIRLLREDGYLINLNPDFMICDEALGQNLREQAMENVLDKRYETIDSNPAFAELLDLLSAGRDDSRLMEIVNTIYNKVQSCRDSKAWLDNIARQYDLDGIQDAGQTDWGRELLQEASGEAKFWEDRMRKAKYACEADPVFAENYEGALAETEEDLIAFQKACQVGWDSASRASDISFGTVGRKRKGISIPAEDAEFIKKERQSCRDWAKKLHERFADTSDVLLKDLRVLHEPMLELLNIVNDFGEAFEELKHERNVLDFNDVLHLALRLLDGNEETESARLKWSGRFREIMVDEYQDSNELQNAIFETLSDGGNNLFLVGDVKQSIYRFQLADPTVFLQRYQNFKLFRDASDGEGRKILMKKNFRSRPEILAAVNDVFCNIMSRNFGEMDYTEDEMLYQGLPAEAREDAAVEYDLVDNSDDEEEEQEKDERDAEVKTRRDLIEARYTAERIRSFLESGFPVSDGQGGTRNVQPGDIVILHRSANAVLPYYTQALDECGIEWTSESGENLLETTEVEVAQSLLKIIDNPRQDIPLLSVMRSPLYGFTDEKIAQIRAASVSGSFYDAVTEAAEKDTSCRIFLEELNRMRDHSGEISTSELIWNIYEQTNLPGVFGVMPDGEKRRANLNQFYDLARSAEASGHKGLFAFLLYLKELSEEKDTSLGSRTIGKAGGVRIMSIHKAKGLEFPVVFLCGLSRSINLKDIAEPVLFHQKLGLGPKYLDRELLVQYPTLARRAIAGRLKKETEAEELRLLYVAMTRAREKLILVHVESNLKGKIDKLAPLCDSPVRPEALELQKSVGDMLLLTALTRPEAQFITKECCCGNRIAVRNHLDRWNILYSSGTQYRKASEHQRQRGETARETEIPEILLWRDPYQRLAKMPSVLTVTQMKSRNVDQDIYSLYNVTPIRENLKEPDFVSKQKLNNAERGTAYHLLMQFIDYTKTDSEQSVEQELARLVTEEYLTPLQAGSIDPSEITAFFRSELGEHIHSAVASHREFKFSQTVPAEEYYPGAGPAEKIVLLGVIDLWLENEDGSIEVIDFKTDRLQNESAMKIRTEKYKEQVRLYSRALERILEMPVEKKYLWYFDQNRAVAVED